MKPSIASLSSLSSLSLLVSPARLRAGSSRRTADPADGEGSRATGRMEESGFRLIPSLYHRTRATRGITPENRIKHGLNYAPHNYYGSKSRV